MGKTLRHPSTPQSQHSPAKKNSLTFMGPCFAGSGETEALAQVNTQLQPPLHLFLLGGRISRGNEKGGTSTTHLFPCPRAHQQPSNPTFGRPHGYPPTPIGIFLEMGALHTAVDP